MTDDVELRESLFRLRTRALELRATGHPEAIAAAEVNERVVRDALAAVERGETQPSSGRPS